MVGGEGKNMVKGESTGGFFQVGGQSDFQLVGGLSPTIPQVGKTLGVHPRTVTEKEGGAKYFIGRAIVNL